MVSNPIRRYAVAGLLATFILAHADPALATTFIVDDSFAPGQACTALAPSCNTIQQAVDAAVAGDNVQVAAGVYPEAVSVTKRLKLRGNQANVCAQDPMPFDTLLSEAPRAGGESFVEPPPASAGFRLLADQITIDGFHISGADNDAAISVSSDYSGSRLLNNILTGNSIGINLSSNGTIATLVSCNAIIANMNGFGVAAAAGSGIYADQGIKNVAITRNTFSGNQNVAIGLNSNPAGPFNSEGVQITDNDSIEDGAIFINDVDRVEVARNRILGPLNNGIELAGGADLALIHTNVIKAAQWSGIRISTNGGITTDANQTPHINRNIILWSGRADDHCTWDYAAIKISDGAIDTSAAIDVMGNRIAYNYIGILNLDSDDVVDARQSWWGSSTGPSTPANPGGVGDPVIGLVDFQPFLNLTDIPQSAFARQQIEEIVSNGISSGCSASNPTTGGSEFCPNTQVPRSQMAVFLERANRGPNFAPSGIPQQFSDVPPGYPGDQFINQFYLDGFTQGCVAGSGPTTRKFCPAASLLRSEMAVFLLRASHGPSYTPPPATGQVFGDVPADAFAAAFIEQLFFEGVTGGCVGGPSPATRRYCPGNPITRAEMAVFLMRTFDEDADLVRYLVSETDTPSETCADAPAPGIARLSEARFTR